MRKTGFPLRKLFGALRVGAAWQLLWWIVWGPFGAAVSILQPESLDPGEGRAMIAVLALIGLVSGAVFAVFLTSVESGRIAADIPLGRAAIWGALGAATVPLLAGKYDQVFPFCPVGMAIAVALVSMGRIGALRTQGNAAGLPDALFAWVSASLRDATDTGEADPRPAADT